MTGGMPDFAMPSDDDLARQRAEADDEAREAQARAALAVETTPMRHRAAAPVDAASAEGSARPRHRILALARNPIATFVAGAALVAASFAVVPAIREQTQEESLAELDRVVAAYVDAVESGDFEAATRMAPPDGDAADDTLLEQVDAQAGATFDCAEPFVDGDAASVTCQATVTTFGASNAPLRLRLVRDGGWRIETGFAIASPLWIPLSDVSAIGGTTVPDDLELEVDPIWLYPGSYELELATAPRVEALGTTMSVLGDRFLWAGTLQPGPEMVDELTTAALDYVAACASLGGEGCPDVAPLGPGERFETLTDGFPTYGGDRELVLGVLVRRIGGAPDQWGIDVRVQFSDDLDSFVVAPGVPSL